ncbi:MAG: BamA/TamA family outer membrane protein [Candidatus Thiodiazotropha sp.]
MTAQLELLFPAFGEDFDDTVRAGWFIDAGNVFDLEGGQRVEWDQIRVSTGLMLSWYSPVGPLSFSLGYPVANKESDSLEKFQFRIGAGF